MNYTHLFLLALTGVALAQTDCEKLSPASAGDCFDKYCLYEDSKCVSCRSGYFNVTSHTCVDECKDSNYYIKEANSISFCDYCEPTGQYYIPGTESDGAKCVKCSVENCKTCSSNNCTACLEEFFLKTDNEGLTCVSFEKCSSDNLYTTNNDEGVPVCRTCTGNYLPGDPHSNPVQPATCALKQKCSDLATEYDGSTDHTTEAATCIDAVDDCFAIEVTTNAYKCATLEPEHGYYRLNISNVYNMCLPGCKTCASFTNCNACYEGKYLKTVTDSCYFLFLC